MDGMEFPSAHLKLTGKTEAFYILNTQWGFGNLVFYFLISQYE